MAKQQVRVLFLCTGNLCRSPFTEGILRARAADAGLSESLLVDSAGMDAESGRAPEALAIESSSRVWRRHFESEVTPVCADGLRLF